jgi:hypothetical protein
VKSHMAAIALGEEDRFLEDGHTQKLPPVPASSTRRAASRTARTRRARCAVEGS